MRSLYCAEKVRRLLPATTSGSGRGGAAAALLPAAALRSDSLRSSSPRCAAGSKAGEVEAIPLIFTLIPVLALLSNYDQENCLINVGTEGPTSASNDLSPEEITKRGAENQLPSLPLRQLLCSHLDSLEKPA